MLPRQTSCQLSSGKDLMLVKDNHAKRNLVMVSLMRRKQKKNLLNKNFPHIS